MLRKIVDVSMRSIGAMIWGAFNSTKSAITASVAAPCKTKSTEINRPSNKSKRAYPMVMAGRIRCKLVSGSWHMTARNGSVLPVSRTLDVLSKYRHAAAPPELIMAWIKAYQSTPRFFFRINLTNSKNRLEESPTRRKFQVQAPCSSKRATPVSSDLAIGSSKPSTCRWSAAYKGILMMMYVTGPTMIINSGNK